MGRIACTPPMSAPTRKLVAILAGDVAGYSKLMGEDETRTWQPFSIFPAELELSFVALLNFGVTWRAKAHDGNRTLPNLVSAQRARRSTG